MSQVVGCGFGWSGGGGGSSTITGGGTVPFIPKFTSPTTIGDSQMADDGTTVFIGVSATSTSALFETKSTTQGVLFPRMTTIERDAIPVGATEDSLFIFNTSLDKFQFWDFDTLTWTTIESSALGGETWSQILTNGATSGGVNPELSDGDVLKAVNGGGELNLRAGADSQFSLTGASGAFTQSWLFGDATSMDIGFSTNKLETSATNWNWIDTATTRMTLTTAGKLGLGTPTPVASALFEMSSTTAGFLSPRMTLVQRNAIGTPATGLWVYQTDGTAGFYYFNGSLWIFNGTGTDGIYGGGGTVPSTTIATLTDTLSFGTNLLFINETTSQVGVDTTVFDADSKFEVQGGTSTFLNGTTTRFLSNNTASYSENTKTALTGSSFFGSVSVGQLDDIAVGDATTSIRGSLNNAVWNQDTTGGASLTSTNPMVGSINSSILIGLGTVSEGVGASNTIRLIGAGATMTLAVGSLSRIASNNSGTVTEWRGFYAPDMTGTTGIPATTARYGIYVEDLGQNYLRKSLGINQLAPTSQVHVTGEGATSSTSSLLIEDSSNSPILFVRDDSRIGINISTPISALDVVTGTTGGAVSFYLNEVGGSAVARVNAINFYYNDSDGDRQLGNINIQSRVESLDATSVSTSITIGDAFKVDDTKQILIGNSVLSSSTGLAQFYVKGLGHTSTSTMLIDGNGTTTNVVFQLRNSANNSLFIVSGNGKTTFNSSSITTADFQVKGLADANTLYVDVSSNGVGFGRATATAKVHITAGTATAGTAPLIIDTGTLLTVAVTGTFEFADDFFYTTANSIRTSISTFGRSVASAATYTVLITDRLVGVTITATEASTVDLPSAALYPSGYQLTIKDEALNASTFNITIDASASQTIDGNLTFTINVDGDAVTIYSNGVDAWFVM